MSFAAAAAVPPACAATTSATSTATNWWGRPSRAAVQPVQHARAPARPRDGPTFLPSPTPSPTRGGRRRDETRLDIHELGLEMGARKATRHTPPPVYERTGTEYDERIGRHTKQMAALAALSAVLVVVILQLPWTGSAYEPDDSTEALKAALSAVTAALLWRLYAYYQLQVFVGRVRLGVLGRVPLRHSSLFKWFVVELAVCAAHPLPFVARGYEKVGIVVLVRLYLVLRVWRDCSPVYRLRRDILSSGRLKRGMPFFNSSLTVREAFYRRPFGFAFAAVALSLALFSYVLHVAERTAQPDVFGQLDNCVYYVAVTASTVGFGDMTARTGWGRFLSATVALVGILLAALLVAALIRSLELDSNERAAAEYVAWRAQHTREQRVAVRYLEAAWLRHRHLRDRARGMGGGAAERKPPRKLLACPPCARGEDVGSALTFEWLEHRRQFREAVQKRLTKSLDDGDLVMDTLTRVDDRLARLERLLGGKE